MDGRTFDQASNTTAFSALCLLERQHCTQAGQEGGSDRHALLWSPGRAAGELQVHKRVHEESNEEHMAQHASAICSQTHGSSPGYQEVNQKNREELYLDLHLEIPL